MKQGRDNFRFDVIVTIVITVISLIILYPILFVLMASFSEPYEVASGNVFLLPKGFTLASPGAPDFSF